MVHTGSMRLMVAVLANALLPIAALIFAWGFFPYKPLLPGLATWDIDKEVGFDTRDTAMFDRVVFLVVDALRSDFVYGHRSGFQFTQSLVRDGAAIPFTAHAAPPTVTMPRIKALTTGSVPSFADLIFNLDEGGTGSSLAGQDTWLAQIKARGGKLVFYGDDTWLRLFPAEFFARVDGTSSFFVSDFTEVDTNVTRHVREEMNRDDWDAFIMHYLGLDHIGHKTGPNGPNMIPKQQEMDAVIRLVYNALENQPHQSKTLLVLAGDHGMNSAGNHGGSGPGETEPALLFASPKFKTVSKARRRLYECPAKPKDDTDFHYYTKVQQSDLVPTLAGLLNFPVPKNSLGIFIDEIRCVWSSTGDDIRLLQANARQMERIIEAKFGKSAFTQRVLEHKSYLVRNETHPLLDDEPLASHWARVEIATADDSLLSEDEVVTTLRDFLLVAQSFLSNAASSYNIPWMVSGILVGTMAFVLASYSLRPSWPPSTPALFMVLVIGLYAAMMFASSYVEEEQHFWYWMTPAWITSLTIRRLRGAQNVKRWAMTLAAAIAILGAHRLAVRWNQTGQKHSGEPDVVHVFFPAHHILLWVLILASYLFNGVQIMTISLVDIMSQEVRAVVAAALVLPAIGFKLNFTQADAPELVQGLAEGVRRLSSTVPLVQQAQLALSLLGMVLLSVIGLTILLSRNTPIVMGARPAIRITLPERIHYLLTLFLMTQSRAPNIPLFLGLELQRRSLAVLLAQSSVPTSGLKTQRSSRVSPTELGISILLFSHTYFFCMGGSNSISSVDLSNAYNGVADYNVVAVGVLLFASNWTGPIWWCSAAVLQTFSRLQHTTPKQSPSGRQWIDTEREKLRETALSKVTSQSTTVRPDDGLDPWLVYVVSMTAFIAASLVGIMATCTLLRTHLFIWTVFSPKYLYAMAWAIGWHLLVNVGLGSTLRYLGQIG